MSDLGVFLAGDLLGGFPAVPEVDGVVPATFKHVAGVLAEVRQQLDAADADTAGSWDGNAASWFHAVTGLERTRATETARAHWDAAGVSGRMWEDWVQFVLEVRRLSHRMEELRAQHQAVLGPTAPLPPAELQGIMAALQAAFDRLAAAGGRNRDSLYGLTGSAPTVPPTPRPRPRGGFASAVHPGLAPTGGWTTGSVSAALRDAAALGTAGATSDRRAALDGAGDTAGVAALDRIATLSGLAAPTNAELAELRALQAAHVIAPRPAAAGAPGPGAGGATATGDLSGALSGGTTSPWQGAGRTPYLAGVITEPSAARRGADGTVSLLDAEQGAVVSLGAGVPVAAGLAGGPGAFEDEDRFGTPIEVPSAAELEELVAGATRP